jgi:predicted enzyme related to lactoylglutathione lyase
MARVIGIGGVFFKARGDHRVLAAWYKEKLGIDVQPWGGAIFRGSDKTAKDDGDAAWSIDDRKSERYDGSDSGFLINYRVDDLAGLMTHLQKAGVKILKDAEKSEYGFFASILDPEGNRIELWEP